MQTRVDAQEEVAAAIDDYVRALTNRDVEGLIALHADEPDTIAIGTGRDEKYVGLEELRRGIERDFAQSEGMNIRVENRSIAALGDVAWLAADVRGTARVGGSEVGVDGRLTAVYERRGEKWLVRHSHFSVPASDQPEGASFSSRPRDRLEPLA